MRKLPRRPWNMPAPSGIVVGMRTVLLLLLLSCTTPPPEPPPPPVDMAGPPPADAVAARLAETHARLAQSEAGQQLRRTLDAHGGLEPWLSAGTVTFTFDYRPLGKPERRMYTRNEVDLWSARARQIEQGGDASLGWDGEVAWIVPWPEAFPGDARFWALTPYYFTGMPWVVADPGTRLSLLEPVEVLGQRWTRLKVTYAAGTGDSPDDYYVLFIDPETDRMGALIYIVSYPGFFEEGQSSPEKFMRYLDHAEVDGLSVVGRIETLQWDPETLTPGDKTTDVDVTDVSFGRPWPAALFKAPPGAYRIPEIERRSD
ncbi:MAG: hypothetical protein H6739_38595 [Alphaproteobacteria bacterium]|nr:hypothetical protein [Alphaproteobacteria bacterium]